MYTFVAEIIKNKGIMKHRQFKTECVCVVIINGKVYTCTELREAKKIIYALGIRGERYRVDVVDKNVKIVNDTYLMQYTKEGPIFQKQIYSRWKEELAKARIKQLTIIASL